MGIPERGKLEPHREEGQCKHLVNYHYTLTQVFVEQILRCYGKLGHHLVGGKLGRKHLEEQLLHGKHLWC